MRQTKTSYGIRAQAAPAGPVRGSVLSGVVPQTYKLSGARGSTTAPPARPAASSAGLGHHTRATGNAHGRVISSFVCPLNQGFGTSDRTMDKMIFHMPRNEEIYHESTLVANKHRYDLAKQRQARGISPSGRSASRGGNSSLINHSLGELARGCRKLATKEGGRPDDLGVELIEGRHGSQLKVPGRRMIAGNSEASQLSGDYASMIQ